MNINYIYALYIGLGLVTLLGMVWRQLKKQRGIYECSFNS